MTTFPHFIRFLIYTNLSLWYLGHLLWLRFAVLWEHRLLPAYLGPSLSGLVSLSLLTLVCFFTSLALGIMFANTIKTWVFNQTMIEGWEQDRHESLIERGNREWWDVSGPNGETYRFEKLEFPYDIGIFNNMAQAMGTRNIILWLWPFASNPTISKDNRGAGWVWEENGFNRTEGLWPPFDPEKIRRAARGWPASGRDYDKELRDVNLSPEEMVEGFQKRQAQDLRRKRQLLAELEEVEDYDMYDDEEYDRTYDEALTWTNSDGERLRDYGVDEDAESVDEAEDDDIPLAELIRRRRVVKVDADE